jgi:cystathionine beta-lyase/cystathionine gamma-synthase
MVAIPEESSDSFRLNKQNPTLSVEPESNTTHLNVMADAPDASPSATQAVHAGRDDLRAEGVHAPPLDLSTTYPFRDLDDAAESLNALAHGAAEANEPVYSRLHNPTVARCENAVAELEGADHCVAFGSGMAAVTASLLAAGMDERHVVAVRPCYGTTDHLLSSGLLGLDVTWTTPERIGEAVRDETALVLVETPANPTLQLVDLEAAAEQAGPVPVLVDSTFAPPVLQRPLNHGAALSLHSATKFLGGHGDVVGGVVSTNDADWAERLRQVRVMTGALLHPMAAYLMHRSLPTLPARVERAQATAQILAERLASHPALSSVHYPGLHESPLLGAQMSGPGTMISFDVDDFDAARRLLQHTDHITPAVSLGAVDSLLQHPASLTHGVVDAEARERSGITPGLLRLSVGLEDADDLWQDLSTAIDTATPAVPSH